MAEEKAQVQITGCEIRNFTYKQGPKAGQEGTAYKLVDTNGTSYDTMDKALVDFIKSKGANPVSITFDKQENGNYTNRKILEVEGYAKKAYSGGGGYKGNPEVDNRSYAMRYVTDMFVALIAAGAIKMDAKKLVDFPTIAIPIADEIARYVVSGKHHTIAVDPATAPDKASAQLQNAIEQTKVEQVAQAFNTTAPVVEPSPDDIPWG